MINLNKDFFKYSDHQESDPVKFFIQIPRWKQILFLNCTCGKRLVE